MNERTAEPLVTRRDLEALIDSQAGLEPYAEALKKRWVGMVMWWHNRSVEAKRRYFALRAVIVAGGVLIPVLTTLSMLDALGQIATILIAVLGAVVAGCAAWEAFANYGETWREKRRAAELLKVEGWQFLQLCGKYEKYVDYDRAFPRFAYAVEQMVAREVGEYLAVFEPTVTEFNEAAGELSKAILEEAQRRATAV